MFLILVGRKFDNGIFWEIIWYSEEYNQTLASQCDEPEWNKDGLVSRFEEGKAIEIVGKMDLKSKYDFVEIKKSIEKKAENTKIKSFADRANEYLILS